MTEFVKSKSFLTWTEMPNKCYLYHNRTAPDRLDIRKHTNSLSKEELVRQISTSISRIGRRNLNDNY
jgi:hypothetical protein